MSLNSVVVLHEALGKKIRHPMRSDFRRIVYSTYPAAIEDLDQEVAELEARHDIIIVGRVGAAMQVRPAVVMKLRGRGWIESTKNGLVLLSPPGFVAALKGLGMIHGLGEITPEPLLTPGELVGGGVGAAIAVTGIVLEGKVGIILGVLGGLVTLIAGGSAAIRHLKSSQTSAAAGSSLAPAAAAAAAAPPPPPPPPPKPTSQQRLQAAVTAYGPLAAELIKGVVSLF